MGGTGDTKCDKIDGCNYTPPDLPKCSALVTCTDIPAPSVGFVCGNCPVGYIGDGQTCEVDMCASSPCR
eukprot:9484527-Pyramimonas_sp.AAC.1